MAWIEPIAMVIAGRTRDLGGFSVRRVLPEVKRKTVGPFIFFDHMGPAEFKPGEAIDVRPHPHINLATVTYLFAGQILHRDSLGSHQLIEPGAINWMIAGRGIVHSERATEERRRQGGPINGIQCWVALPEAHEEMAPQFSHRSAVTLPEFRLGEAQLKLLLGSLAGHTSPVPVQSDLFYADAQLDAGASCELPIAGREAAVYVASGRVQIGAAGLSPGGTTELSTYSMGVAAPATEKIRITALERSRLMLLGGAAIGRRHIYWNFVSSSKERMQEAITDWGKFPNSSRFAQIADDQDDFIPLPKDPFRGD